MIFLGSISRVQENGIKTEVLQTWQVIASKDSITEKKYCKSGYVFMDCEFCARYLSTLKSSVIAGVQGVGEQNPEWNKIAQISS